MKSCSHRRQQLFFRTRVRTLSRAWDRPPRLECVSRSPPLQTTLFHRTVSCSGRDLTTPATAVNSKLAPHAEKRCLQTGAGPLCSLVVHWHQHEQIACRALDRRMKLWFRVCGLRQHQFRAEGDFCHSPPVFGLGLIQAPVEYST